MTNRRPLVLAILLALSGPALADDRQAADLLSKDAQASKDPARALACGQAYLDIYNKNPEAKGNDEVLYNASVCYETGRAIGSAIQVSELLRKYYPNSKLTAPATLRLGRIYARIAMHDRGAEKLEEYAKKYAGEKDAADAMRDAVQLRALLGDDAGVLADANYYAKTWGVKQPAEAAAVQYAAAVVLETRGGDPYVKALQGFVKQYAAKATVEMQIDAYTRLGEELWHRACPSKEIDGLCVKVARASVRVPRGVKQKAATQPTQCGPDGGAKVAVVARDAGQSKEAVAAFLAAATLFEKSGSTDAGAKNAYARVKLLVADRDLEAYVAITAPAGLDFASKKEASLKKFNDYVTEKVKLGAKAQQQYEAVLGIKDAHGAIAAAARIGQVSLLFSNELFGMQIPADVRTGKDADDKVGAFCDKMSEVAEPLETRAIDAFNVCVTKSTQLGVDTPYTRLCVRELGQARPDQMQYDGEVYAAMPAPMATAFEPALIVANPPAPMQTAMAKYVEVDKAGAFSPTSCKAVAAQFAAVVKSTPKVAAQANYMAGLAFHRCGFVAEAQAAYDTALKVDATLAAASSNAAELLFRAGKRAEARAAWEKAIATNGKLYGARVNLAAMMIDELRAMPVADRAKAKQRGDIELNLSSALAVDDSNPAAFVQYALYESARENRRRALHFLAEAATRNAKDASVAFASAAAYGADAGTSFTKYTEAVALDPANEGARLGLALANIKLRRYDAALAELKKLKVSYDVHVATGVALRGMRKYSDAIAAYDKAVALDANRPEAHFDAALARETLAATMTDLDAGVAEMQRAKDAYAKALAAAAKHPAIAAEAKARIDTSTKFIKLIGDFKASQLKAPVPALPTPKK